MLEAVERCLCVSGEELELCAMQADSSITASFADMSENFLRFV